MSFGIRIEQPYVHMGGCLSSRVYTCVCGFEGTPKELHHLWGPPKKIHAHMTICALVKTPEVGFGHGEANSNLHDASNPCKGLMTIPTNAT